MCAELLGYLFWSASRLAAHTYERQRRVEDEAGCPDAGVLLLGTRIQPLGDVVDFGRQSRILALERGAGHAPVKKSLGKIGVIKHHRRQLLARVGHLALGLVKSHLEVARARSLGRGAGLERLALTPAPDVVKSRAALVACLEQALEQRARVGAHVAELVAYLVYHLVVELEAVELLQPVVGKESVKAVGSQPQGQQGHAHRVIVGGAVDICGAVFGAHRAFGRHEVARLGRVDLHRAVAADRAGDAEVCEDKCRARRVGEEEILGLDVAVEYVAVVALLDAECHAPRHIAKSFLVAFQPYLGQRAVRGVGHHLVVESDAGVERVVPPAVVVEVDDKSALGLLHLVEDGMIGRVARAIQLQDKKTAAVVDHKYLGLARPFAQSLGRMLRAYTVSDAAYHILVVLGYHARCGTRCHGGGAWYGRAGACGGRDCRAGTRGGRYHGACAGGRYCGARAGLVVVAHICRCI